MAYETYDLYLQLAAKLNPSFRFTLRTPSGVILGTEKAFCFVAAEDICFVATEEFLL